MNIIISKYTPVEIQQAVKEFNYTQANVPGTLWINTDDGRNLAVICASDQEFVGGFSLLQSTIAQIRNITEYVYVIVVNETEDFIAHQLLSIQELGAFTAIIPYYSELPKLIKFISNPKRRAEKVVHPPCRSLRMYTPGEQLLLTIPNIGEKKVAMLLKTGPIAWILASLTDYNNADPLDGLEGIAKRDIDSFRQTIQLENDQILAVIMKEDKE